MYNLQLYLVMTGHSINGQVTFVLVIVFMFNNMLGLTNFLSSVC